MNKTKILKYVTVCSILLGAASAQAGPVTITSSNWGIEARENGGSSTYSVDTFTFFGNRTLTASNGGSNTNASIEWVDSSAGAFFFFDWNHSRTGSSSSLSQTYNTGLNFTVAEDTTYSLAGLYDVDGSGSAGRVLSDIVFTDVTNNTELFKDLSWSESTLNESFTLGDAGDGDLFNTTNGSLTGNLLAGNSYRFYFNNYTGAYPDADGGATGSGCLSLSIGGVGGANSCGAESVPEPAPLMLMSLGLAGLIIRRRQQSALQR